MKAVRIIATLVALALIADVALAQPAPGGGGAGGRGGRGRGGFGGGVYALLMNPVDRVQTQLKTLTLSDDEKTKTDAVITEYTPKIKDAVDAAKKTLTDDHQKAVDDVAKAIAAAGTDRTARGEAMQKIRDVKLTDDETKALTEKATAVTTLSTELRTKVADALTPENKTKFTASMRGPGGRGGRGGRGGARPGGSGATPAPKPEA